MKEIEARMLIQKCVVTQDEVSAYAARIAVQLLQA